MPIWKQALAVGLGSCIGTLTGYGIILVIGVWIFTGSVAAP